MSVLSLFDSSFEPQDSQEAQVIRGFKAQVESIYTMLSYEVDLRNVSKEDIDDWEQELRAIIKGIRYWERVSNISAFLVSCDAVQEWIGLAIRNLYLASDILGRKKCTISEREKFYALLQQDCPRHLSRALEYFSI